MRTDLYYKILKPLAKKGIGQQVDISKIVSKHFKHPMNSGFILNPREREDNVVAFLNMMLKKDHLLNYTNTSPFINKKTYEKPIFFTAAISDKGLEYYKTNYKHWWNSSIFWTALGVIIPLILALIAYFNSNRDGAKPVKKQVLPLNNKQSSRSSQSTKEAAPKASSVDSSRKH